MIQNLEKPGPKTHGKPIWIEKVPVAEDSPPICGKRPGECRGGAEVTHSRTTKWGHEKCLTLHPHHGCTIYVHHLSHVLSPDQNEKTHGACEQFSSRNCCHMDAISSRFLIAHCSYNHKTQRVGKVPRDHQVCYYISYVRYV